MNFLAHLYLSGSSENILIGNFIGDFVKGKAYQSYPEQIQQGIRLHREIDSFTDSHQCISDARKRLWGNFRHYSGVVIDLFNDHFLATSWSDFSEIPLTDFASDSYDTLQKNFELLPPGAQHMLPYMIEGNWLVNYGTIKGIDRALTGLSNRTKFTSNMENASGELERDYNFYRDVFTDFFPDLMKFVTGRNPYFNLPHFK